MAACPAIVVTAGFVLSQFTGRNEPDDPSVMVGSPFEDAANASDFEKLGFIIDAPEGAEEADITASHMIQFRGVQYDIVRIDPFEGYKADLKLYCKRKDK